MGQQCSNRKYPLACNAWALGFRASDKGVDDRLQIRIDPRTIGGDMEVAK